MGYGYSDSNKLNSGYGASYGRDSRDYGREREQTKGPLVPFEKKFYQEHPAVAARSQWEVEAFLKEKEITTKGSSVPKPVMTFEEAGFPESILRAIQNAGFKEPSAIQVQAWPVALSGRDMIGIAATGSGKTAGFLLPALVHISAQPQLQRGDGPICLVLAPTRELAMQIQAESEKFSHSTSVRSVAVYGGAPKGGQVRDLRMGAEIVVATPGRLIDFMTAGTLSLSRVTYMVLDEADRMLDMGFEPDIRKVIAQVRPDRQNCFWSATWPRNVQRLAHEMCKSDPVQINVGNSDGELKANQRIKQTVEVVKPMEKMDRVWRLMQSVTPNAKVILFCGTKRGADNLAGRLSDRRHYAAAIHGDKEQWERERILRDFKSGKCPILVATAVAARGLDVPDVELVVNYDFPTQVEDYVHQIGRTGRAGKSGAAYTLFTEDDGHQARKLVNILLDANQEVSPALKALVGSPGNPKGRGKGKGGSRGGKGGSKGGYGGSKGGSKGGYGRY